MAFDFALRTPVLVLVLLAAVYRLYVYWTTKVKLPDGVPWVGRSIGLFSESRTSWSSVRNFRALLEQASDLYSKKGLVSILPTVSDRWVLLPDSYSDWVANKPDSVLDPMAIHKEMLEMTYTISHPALVQRPIHLDIIRRDLTRQLGNLTTEIMTELSAAFDETWGTDTENWKEINVLQNMTRVVARTSNRIFVGAPMCRNEGFLHAVSSYSQALGLMPMIIRLCPQWTKPVLGHLLALPIHYYDRKTRRFLVPFIQLRLENVARKQREPDFKWEAPNDLLQWTINETQRCCPASDLAPVILCARMLLVNFTAIHTSSITSTNVLLDLFSAAPEHGFVDGVRDEVQRVLADDGGVWTKAGLGKMVRTDSAIREAMRLNGFSAIGLGRKVVGHDGVTLDTGLHIPHGANVTISAFSVHRDAARYHDPQHYDAFRFAKQRDEFDRQAAGNHTDPTAAADGEAANSEPVNGLAATLKAKNLSMVTTSEAFLAFGYGRHACPGRFFAANEIKLLIAYIVLNYDVQHIASRKPNDWMAEVVLPPRAATIMVRRKRGTASVSV
ncbi:MAG: hypothetical protein M1826_004503 [Phylliscum demangeonii]|nr:MAG: hypothetical protein M1826_004503 [Phylliscum demangeonii]